MSRISVKRKKRRLGCLIAIELVILVLSLLLLFYLLQRYWAHRDGQFVPDYSMLTLTRESDYETIFLQTGLGKAAVDKLLEEGDFQTILDMQEKFFYPVKTECTPLLGWFTREDRLVPNTSISFVDLQPGDILVTLSTHTGGWVHGHAGLVIDENTTLEARVLGTDSGYGSLSNWKDYSNVAVLRVKDASEEQRQAVVDYAKENLVGVPYSLVAGFVGDKAPDTESWYFGLHCSYLVWYAWQEMGYDLDCDGGRLVTSSDLLYAEQLEIVQIYGMDPRDFIEE